jgi:hypothetical protein
MRPDSPPRASTRREANRGATGRLGRRCCDGNERSYFPTVFFRISTAFQKSALVCGVAEECTLI